MTLPWSHEGQLLTIYSWAVVSHVLSVTKTKCLLGDLAARNQLDGQNLTYLSKKLFFVRCTTVRCCAHAALIWLGQESQAKGKPWPNGKFATEENCFHFFSILPINFARCSVWLLALGSDDELAVFQYFAYVICRASIIVCWRQMPENIQQ